MRNPTWWYPLHDSLHKPVKNVLVEDLCLRGSLRRKMFQRKAACSGIFFYGRRLAELAVEDFSMKACLWWKIFQCKAATGKALVLLKKLVDADDVALEFQRELRALGLEVDQQIADRKPALLLFLRPPNLGGK